MKTYKTKLVKGRGDQLTRAGWMRSTIAGFEDMSGRQNIEGECVKVIFDTPAGRAGALYNIDTPQLTHLILSAGVDIDGIEEYELNQLIGRKVLILWGFRRKGTVCYPKALLTKPFLAKTPDFKPLTAAEWSIYGCDRDGIFLTVSSHAPAAPAQEEEKEEEEEEEEEGGDESTAVETAVDNIPF